ncbi:uncharacterized protein (TIGR02117 family) [Altererythrobacter atlanticus]|uniref:Uncharacterized protein n=1 Tax=Croceibacterium atlanticum TaxID=1267766 RepID=A0A0F7KP15_9SPHN|nr:DUF2459 domain-containing protein [Croceibacterium atlanticum]AKH41324.1 hypothetical protein WYH_00260 [Croceibacterium atlanticum]MBB5734163.1 uncharacterized protein (TIGR02117 family) [Croceibacterium atlanticum]
MAAPAIHRLIRVLGTFLIGVVLALVLFALAGWIGSSIPRNAGWQEPDRGVTVMVESNGIHTAIIMPLLTKEKDWRRDFPVADIADRDRPYTHVSVSWGEHDVFLETPTWWDLSPITVARIIGLGGEGVLHVAHYVRPAPSDHARPVRLTRAEYRRLVAAIEGTIPPRPRVIHPGYGGQDVFYDTHGRYTPTNTCNQWTSDMLARAGMRMGWWTPFAGGVMKWLPEPGES